MAGGLASSLIPVGVAIDEERRLAFISDGGNNRVLVFDISRETLASGADALAVIGQPDFSSKDINLDDAGMNSPGHLAYDPDHDRLFVVDSLHHRILVFDVGADALMNGMSASRVIGQPNFTTNLPMQSTRRYAVEPDDRTLPYPNGITYDPVKQRLYVTDRGNDRVVVFDTAPEKLENYPHALAVLGQRDPTTHSPHLESDLSGQDQLYNARGMAIDSKNQLLYVSDSHFARIMAFNFPADRRPVSANAMGTMSLSTLDPYVVLKPWETRTGSAVLAQESNAPGIFTLTQTRFYVEPLSQRQSRQLISQSAAVAPQATHNSLVFINQQDESSTVLFIANPGGSTAEVEFSLLDDSGHRSSTSKRLEGGSSMKIRANELLETTFNWGALSLKSSSPVAISAWYETTNRYGEKLLSTLPVAYNTDAEPGVLPGLVTGGGYRNQIVLLNPDDEPMKGALVLFTEDGQEASSFNYALEPASAQVWTPPGGGIVPVGRYVAALPLSGNSPALAALVEREENGLITATTVTAYGKTEPCPDPIEYLAGPDSSPA